MIFFFLHTKAKREFCSTCQRASHCNGYLWYPLWASPQRVKENEEVRCVREGVVLPRELLVCQMWGVSRNIPSSEKSAFFLDQWGQDPLYPRDQWQGRGLRTPGLLGWETRPSKAGLSQLKDLINTFRRQSWWKKRRMLLRPWVLIHILQDCFPEMNIDCALCFSITGIINMLFSRSAFLTTGSVVNYKMPHMNSEYCPHNCTIKPIFRLLLLVLALSDWKAIRFILRKSHIHTQMQQIYWTSTNVLLTKSYFKILLKKWPH